MLFELMDIPTEFTLILGWFDRDLRISVSNNFFEEDDLGKHLTGYFDRSMLIRC